MLPVYHLLSEINQVNLQFGLDHRSLRCLYESGISTVEELYLLYNYGSLSLLGFGEHSAENVEKALADWEKHGKPFRREYNWIDMLEHAIVFDGLDSSCLRILSYNGVFTIYEFITFINENFSSFNFLPSATLFSEKKRFLEEKFNLQNTKKLNPIVVKDFLTPFYEKWCRCLLSTFVPYVYSYKELHSLYMFFANVLFCVIVKQTISKNTFTDADIYLISKLFYSNNYLCSILRRYLLDKLKTKEHYSKNDFLNDCPFLEFPESMMENLCSEDGKSMITRLPNTSYQFGKMSLIDWVHSLSGRYVSWLTRRLNGMTLQAIGDEESCTREYVRQVCDRILVKRPQLIEDDYLPLFERYYWTVDSFCAATGTEPQVFYYLTIIATVSRRKRADVIEIFSDNSVSQIIKDRLKEFFGHSVLFYNDDAYYYNKMTLLNIAIKELAQDKISVVEFGKRYKKFLKDNGYPADSFTRKTLDSRILRCDNVVLGLHDSIRYYPLEDLDVSLLEKSLHLSDMKDIVFSTKLLFDSYPEIMKVFDIRDEYELHSILRRKKEFIITKIHFLRMPNLSIGKSSVKKQMVDLLKENQRITLEEFAKKYCALYGTAYTTFYANHAKALREFHFGDRYITYSDKQLSNKEINSMKGLLTRDIYSKREVNETLGAKIGADKTSLLNDAVFLKLGYRRIKYGYVKRTYASTAEALNHYFSISVQQMDKIFLQDPSVRPYVFERMKNMTLFRSDFDMFVNQDWLQEHGYTPEGIRDFISAVSDFVGNEVFSISSLAYYGFNHPYMKNKKDYWLLSSFLKIDSQYQFLSKAKYVLFSREVFHPSMCDVVEFLLTKHGKLPISKLLRILKDVYGIEADKFRVNNICLESRFKYSALKEERKHGKSASGRKGHKIS